MPACAGMTEEGALLTSFPRKRESSLVNLGNML
jgi:hypothetical protein